MQDFESYLISNLPKIDSFHPTYEAALSEMVICGGKRFRPKLLLAVVQTYEPRMLKNSYDAAMALELMHTYSLIHDDLPCMDDAELRRGHPTLHTTYDEATAVLVGDALNAHAFSVLAKARLSNDVKVQLIEVLVDAAGANGMVLGQAIDMHFEKKELTLQQLEFMHGCKTAKMIAASLKMGAIICCLGLNLQEELYEFGMKLGLFFQVRDDIIDEVQDSSAAGKSTQKDGFKNSFVTLLGLDAARTYAERLKLELHGQLEGFGQPLQDGLNLLLASYFEEI